MPDLILIGGGRCSGKSELADAIARHLTNQTVAVCSLESYYKSAVSSKANCFDLNNLNSIDIDCLLDDIAMLRDGLAIYAPVYDLVSKRREGFKMVCPCDVVILDGVFSLCFDKLREWARLKVFVDCCEEVMFCRKFTKGRVYIDNSKYEILRGHCRCLDPAFNVLVRPTIDYADIVVSGEEDPDEAADKVLYYYDKKAVKCGY